MFALEEGGKSSFGRRKFNYITEGSGPGGGHTAVGDNTFEGGVKYNLHAGRTGRFGKVSGLRNLRGVVIKKSLEPDMLLREFGSSGKKNGFRFNAPSPRVAPRRKGY